MFMSADWVVKAVILGLIFASLATWTILIAKTAQLFRARRQLGDNLAASPIAVRWARLKWRSAQRTAFWSHS